MKMRIKPANGPSNIKDNDSIEPGHRVRISNSLASMFGVDG